MIEDSPFQGIILLVHPYSYIDTSFRGPKPMSRSYPYYPFLTSHNPNFLSFYQEGWSSLAPSLKFMNVFRRKLVPNVTKCLTSLDVCFSSDLYLVILFHFLSFLWMPPEATCKNILSSFSFVLRVRLGLNCLALLKQKILSFYITWIKPKL